MGSYGFDAVTPYAARLEQAVHQSQEEQAILSAAAELIDICRRVRPGLPLEEAPAVTETSRLPLPLP